MKTYSFISAFLLLFLGCSVENPSSTEAEELFRNNRKQFDYIQKFFSSNKYGISEFSFHDGGWKIQMEEYTKFLHNKNMVAGREIDTLLSYFSNLNIVSVDGDSTYLNIHFNHGFSNCFIIYYRTVLYPDELEKELGKTYYDKEKEFWQIRLEDNWLSKRVRCI